MARRRSSFTRDSEFGPNDQTLGELIDWGEAELARTEFEGGAGVEEECRRLESWIRLYRTLLEDKEVEEKPEEEPDEAEEEDEGGDAGGSDRSNCHWKWEMRDLADRAIQPPSIDVDTTVAEGYRLYLYIICKRAGEDDDETFIGIVFVHPAGHFRLVLVNNDAIPPEGDDDSGREDITFENENLFAEYMNGAVLSAFIAAAEGSAR